MRESKLRLAAMAAIGLTPPVDTEATPAPKPARKSRVKVKVKPTGAEIATRDLEAHRKFTAKRLKKAPAPQITRQQRRAAEREAAKGFLYRDETTGTMFYTKH